MVDSDRKLVTLLHLESTWLTGLRVVDMEVASRKKPAPALRSPVGESRLILLSAGGVRMWTWYHKLTATTRSGQTSFESCNVRVNAKMIYKCTYQRRSNWREAGGEACPDIGYEPRYRSEVL